MLKFIKLLTNYSNFYIKKFAKKENINKKRKQKANIKISFIVKSKGIVWICFLDIPNVALNQHLLKPIKPKTFATNIKKKQENADTSIKPLNI
jgi:hypothetical protein